MMMMMMMMMMILTLIRSQPYAFSIDGSSGELLAAGITETDTQCWMFDIR